MRFWVAEAKPRGALIGLHLGFLRFLKSLVTDEAVMTKALDIKEMSVGCEANFAQGRKVEQALADVEVARIVDSRLSAKGPALLMILLDTGVLVIGVQGWRHSLGNDTRAKATRGCLDDAPIEYKLHLVGTTYVEVFADYSLEELAARKGAVQHLCKRE